jgi:ferrous iron transport protein B
MKRIALMGMPNTGKSTLFNRLTGAHARVGNWPGITVELLTARLLLGAEMVQIIDLPGVYDLCGDAEDEKVVTTFLDQHRPDLIVFVMAAPQAERQLPLLAELMARQIPLLVVLSMADEARHLGIDIDAAALTAELGLPVCALSAKYGQGMEHLQAALRQGLQRLPVPKAMDLNGLTQLFAHHVQVPAQASNRVTAAIDRVLLHPWLGLPIFFGVMLLMFQAVFALGKPIQDGMNALFEMGREAVTPWLANWPDWASGLLLDGLYSGVATVASFVPLIVLFFVFLSIVEDTGYLSRAAYLMDALMARLGLDGRGFVMLLMGFGCNVPALMGTRVIRSRGMRLLTMLTIPFSLCSARLQVFVFFAAALFSASAAPWVLFSLYLISLITAMVTALVFKKVATPDDAFVLEMPPYRFPTLRQIALRGWLEVRHFLNRASRFIVLGVVLVWLLTHFPEGAQADGSGSWADAISRLLAPLTDPLGIDARLSLALLFGFVAKEVVIGSLAVIYGLEGQALMQNIAQHTNWIQGYSFMLFTLIYTPCLSTIATLHNESKDLRFTLTSVAWSLSLAWLISLVFYQVASRL